MATAFFCRNSLNVTLVTRCGMCGCRPLCPGFVLVGSLEGLVVGRQGPLSCLGRIVTCGAPRANCTVASPRAKRTPCLTSGRKHPRPTSGAHTHTLTLGRFATMVHLGRLGTVPRTMALADLGRIAPPAHRTRLVTWTHLGHFTTIVHLGRLEMVQRSGALAAPEGL